MAVFLEFFIFIFILFSSLLLCFGGCGFLSSLSLPGVLKGTLGVGAKIGRKIEGGQTVLVSASIVTVPTDIPAGLGSSYANLYGVTYGAAGPDGSSAKEQQPPTSPPPEDYARAIARRAGLRTAGDQWVEGHPWVPRRRRWVPVFSWPTVGPGRFRGNSGSRFF